MLAQVGARDHPEREGEHHAALGGDPEVPTATCEVAKESTSIDTFYNYTTTHSNDSFAVLPHAVRLFFVVGGVALLNDIHMHQILCGTYCCTF